MDHLDMLRPLTSLRFVAAMGVVLQHAGIGGYGSISVTFFFVLSGFVIAYSNASKFQSLNVHESVRFWLLRLARLYPVHLLTLLNRRTYWRIRPHKAT